MSIECFLGVDLGTTSIKTVVTDTDGRQVTSGSCPTPWRQTSDGGTETDPEQLVDAVLATMVSVIDDAVELTGDPALVGVGITGMAETGVLLDRAGKSVVPAVAWHDTRSTPQSQCLDPELGRGQFPRETGLPVSPRSSAVTYRWLRETFPEARAGCLWLDVPAYLAYRLCGSVVADRSLAARSGFMDVTGGTWSERLMDWAGAPRGMLPAIVEAGSAAGQIHDVHPQLNGATVTVAGHDHLVASVGAGALAPTDAFDSCGTGEAFIRQLSCPPADGHHSPRSALDRDVIAAAVADGFTVGWHVIPDRQILMAGLGSGRILHRLLALLGADTDRQRLAQLDTQALGTASGADGMHVDDPTEPECALAGIPWDPSPGMAWRAVLEAVNQRGARVSALLDTYTPPATRLVAAGGWLHSTAVRAIKAEFLGCYEIPQVDEAGARGAALLSGYAAGRYRSSDDLPTPPTTNIDSPLGADTPTR